MKNKAIELQLAAELNKPTKSVACSIFMGVPLEKSNDWTASRGRIRQMFAELDLTELSRIQHVIVELKQRKYEEQDIAAKKACCAAMVRTRFVDEFQDVMTWDEFLEELSK